MKTFKNNDELLALVKDREIDFQGADIHCDFDIKLPRVSMVNVGYIKALNIKAHNIIAGEDIKAYNIKATGNIEADNITATGNITALNIKVAGYIKALNIKVQSININ